MIHLKFNPYSTNVPLLYPLKTSKNLGFSDVFRGYRSGTLVENGLTVNEYARNFIYKDQDWMLIPNHYTNSVIFWPHH